MVQLNLEKILWENDENEGSEVLRVMDKLR